jgi:T-complex protein 1 subunit gamma
LAHSLPLLERNIHPVVIIRAFKAALEDALKTIDDISVPVDTQSKEEMLALIKTSIGTKFSSRWSDLMCSLALQAVETVATSAKNEEGEVKTVDLKRYARVEKVPGGEIEESKVLSGVMLNKDVTHPKMRRRIENPRVILLDCPLEYKKGESQTNIEIQKEEDWNRVLQIEEEQIKAMCDRIIEFKPDIVFTEKGVSGKFAPVFSTDVRPRTTLPPQGRPTHHGHPPCPQVGQQPYRACRRCDHCQPHRRLA